MTQRSVVYGCIKDIPDEEAGHRAVNQRAVQALPEVEDWPVLGREMFGAFDRVGVGFCADLVHFGASYQGIEYEWDHWLNEFEALLKKMYWVSAVVHLETALSGNHTYFWHTDGRRHCPGEEVVHVRCEWMPAVASA